eukprot:TRINITY_DN666_c0_g3_i1.p1 TRINITY_DN666_c0_g3~~TRINITY_DN666_c0_g3_i1.p1  ORF type:complete len:317 (+),score=124.91 TRINITY_DN666_c0_g3_i1:121-1071(+)
MSDDDEKLLYSFIAGRLLSRAVGDGKQRLVPDKAKGSVELALNSSGLVVLRWRDRTTQQVDDEFIVFPDDATLKMVKQGSGRVAALHFASTGKRHFFWMQDKDSSRDEAHCARVTELIENGGEEPRADNQPSEFLLNAEDMMEDDADDDLYEDEDDQNDSATTTTTTSAAAAAAAAAATSSSSSSAAQMQSILSSLFGGSGGASATPPLQLGQVLTADRLAPLLRDEAMAPALQELYSFLPDDADGQTRSASDIVDVLRSPQFKQALGQLTAALSSGELAAMLAQLGLPMPDDATFASKSPVEIFLEAFIEKAKQQ